MRTRWIKKQVAINDISEWLEFVYNHISFKTSDILCIIINDNALNCIKDVITCITNYKKNNEKESYNMNEEIKNNNNNENNMFGDFGDMLENMMPRNVECGEVAMMMDGKYCN